MSAVVACSLPVAAQDTVAVDMTACRGQVIAGVDVTSRPPSPIASTTFAPARAVLHVLFQSTTTRGEILRPFLLVEEGDRCDPARLEETARVLRTLPFIASASVRVVADTGERVRIAIETLDEVPLVIGGRWRGGVSGVTFGNENLAGQGLRAVAEWRDGKAFRDGYAVQLQKYSAFGWPVVLGFDGARLPLGNTVEASVTLPFLSNLQRLGWHAGVRRYELYQPFVRSGAPALSLLSERLQWTVGAVTRLGGRSYGVFGGPVMLYDRFQPAANAVLVSDSGIYQPDTNALFNRYRDVTTFRAGAVAGVRALTWSTVRGLGSLDGEQDIARGVQLALVGARGLSALGGEGETDWAAADLYAGMGGGSFFAAVRGAIEGERPQAGGAWQAIVAGGRAAAFLKPSVRRTWELSVEYAGTWRATRPVQLSLGERGGGPRGFESSDLPAGRRVVVRLEERQVMGRVGDSGLWGLAFFTDLARGWAGGAPFGRDLDLQASVGFGLLGAIPPASRRLLRLELAIPVTAAAADSWRVQISARDLLRVFWREPGDAARARAVALPGSVFGWP
ncbi:MAG TPA: hypothetical protein VF178_09765 [Gemmatimonadaceae bacterium]